MRACLMLEPQMGMTYDTLVAQARAALDLGLEGTFRSDHYSRAADGAPSTDAWASLAGLVRDLERGVVGTLVSPVGFRHPGNLAKTVATVAHMSAGPTIELGLGTGWNQAEHDQYAFAFGTFGQRFAILEEYATVVKGVLSGEPFSFDGKHFSVKDCHSSPPATNVRIIIGGGGPKRTPRLAAKFADELNMVMLPVEAVGERVAETRRQLERYGRDPSAFTFSWMGQSLVGADEADLRRRAEAVGKRFGAGADAILERMRGRIPTGTVEQVTDAFGRLREAGIGRLMLQHLALEDPDHLALAAQAARAA